MLIKIIIKLRRHQAGFSPAASSWGIGVSVVHIPSYPVSGLWLENNPGWLIN
jgi:hypothetical protein